jgi:hypothetical protein
MLLAITRPDAAVMLRQCSPSNYKFDSSPTSPLYFPTNIANTKIACIAGAFIFSSVAEKKRVEGKMHLQTSLTKMNSPFKF